MIFQITSRTNDKIKRLVSLREKKNRIKEGLFVIEGKKNFEMALEAGLVQEVYTLKKMKLPAEISQYIINEPVLDKISLNRNPDGLVFVAKIPQLELKKKDKLLFVDNIQDPGNLGTIIRTALAFNYDGVILNEHTVDPFSEKVVSASKGAIFKIPVLFDKLKNYKEKNKIVVSTLSENSVSLEDLNINGPFVLVLGNEGSGVSEETLLLSDTNVKINMQGIDSLNVAIAGGILMYEISKKGEKLL